MVSEFASGLDGTKPTTMKTAPIKNKKQLKGGNESNSSKTMDGTKSGKKERNVKKFKKKQVKR